jgi:hypothetical protein
LFVTPGESSANRSQHEEHGTMSNDNGFGSKEQGKNDAFTYNPNPNPPQTSFEVQKYHEGVREAQYIQEQNGQKKY